MKFLVTFAIVVLLTGCAVAEYFGFYEDAFVLMASPQPSGCDKPECKELDAFELNGYSEVREGKRSWVDFVTRFYALRDRLMPGATETLSIREYRAYQVVLAEQLDSKQITEAQWVYLLQKKIGDLTARNRLVRNSGR